MKYFFSSYFALYMADRESLAIHDFYYCGDGIFIDLSVNPIVFEVQRSQRDIVYCISSPCRTVHKQQMCCKMKCLANQDQPGPFSFLPKEPAHNEIRHLGFGRHLGFHFYLSIMHEVAEIRPRSARLPGRGTPINTTTLICLSHS